MEHLKLQNMLDMSYPTNHPRAVGSLGICHYIASFGFKFNTQINFKSYHLWIILWLQHLSNYCGAQDFVENFK